MAQYTGDWVEGKRHGHGVFINYRANGEISRRYEGGFINDHKHGPGVMYYSEFLSMIGSSHITNDSREFRGSWNRG